MEEIINLINSHPWLFVFYFIILVFVIKGIIGFLFYTLEIVERLDGVNKRLDNLIGEIKKLNNK